MLTVRDTNSYRFCDRLTRRDFLKVGTLGVGGLTLADLLWLKARGAVDTDRRSVIMIWLAGGPSHLDMYDLKPNAPQEIRGPYRPIQTNVPGIQICEHLPMQAKLADRLAIIQGMRFSGEHAAHELITGVGARVRDKRPAFGSVVSRLWNGENGVIHPYVSLGLHRLLGENDPHFDPENPAYLGAAHQPLAGYGLALQSLAPVEGVNGERLANRKGLRRSLDNIRRDIDDSSGSLAGVDRFTVQALDMISSPQARDAFNLEKEPEPVRARYGPKGGDLLLARRLVEAGVRVVTVRFTPAGAWDDHQGIYEKLPARLVAFDQGLTALVTDLHERGLDRDVAVVAWGEFGRTPRVEAEKKGALPGRGHWPQAGFALLAGGGLRTGQVIGETDARGDRAKGNPYTPQNVLATLYHHLGIDPSRTFPDFNGRPQYVLDQREKIEALL